MSAPGFHEIQTVTGWRRMLERFARWCAPQAGWQVLDLGSGPGFLAERLAQAGCRAVAVDLDWRAFQPARLHAAAAAADAGSLPFTSGAFDLIAASNLLFLLPEVQPVLIEMRRCLSVSGQLALLNPSERMSWQAAHSLAEKHQLQGADRSSLLNYARRAESGFRWSEPQLALLLESAGFSLVETRLQMGSGLVRFTRARRGNFGG